VPLPLSAAAAETQRVEGSFLSNKETPLAGEV
jgi:hypothetical protein